MNLMFGTKIPCIGGDSDGRWVPFIGFEYIATKNPKPEYVVDMETGEKLIAPTIPTELYRLETIRNGTNYSVFFYVHMSLTNDEFLAMLVSGYRNKDDKHDTINDH